MRLIVFVFSFVVAFSCARHKENQRINGTGIFQKASLVSSNDAFYLDSILFSEGHFSYVVSGDFVLNERTESVEILFQMKDTVVTLFDSCSVPKTEAKLYSNEVFYSLLCINGSDSLKIEPEIPVILRR